MGIYWEFDFEFELKGARGKLPGSLSLIQIRWCLGEMKWEFEFDLNVNSRAPEGNVVVVEIEFGRFPTGNRHRKRVPRKHFHLKIHPRRHAWRQGTYLWTPWGSQGEKFPDFRYHFEALLNTFSRLRGIRFSTSFRRLSFDSFW